MGNLSIPLSVQKLQKALQVKAKENPGFRFYALYDKVRREDVLQFAYASCKSNKGAAGRCAQRGQAGASLAEDGIHARY